MCGRYRELGHYFLRPNLDGSWLVLCTDRKNCLKLFRQSNKWKNFEKQQEILRQKLKGREQEKINKQRLF